MRINARLHILILAIAISLSPAWGQDGGDTLVLDKTIGVDAISVTHYTPPLEGEGVGLLHIDAEAMERMPQFFAAPDLLRSLQLMSGVQTTGDIASGLYIQGCQPAHNLMLLNGAPIFSPVHLLGFIATLNNDHLESMTLHKSNISAEYGGRLASVVNIETITKRPERVESTVTLGLLNSGVSVNAPLGERSSLILSGRMTHINPVLSLIESLSEEPKISMGYGMYDLNGTWNYRANDQHSFSLNGYYSSDNTDIESYSYNLTCQTAWSNGAASFQWRYTPSSSSALTTTIYDSHFDDCINVDQQVSTLDLVSRIDEAGVRVNQHWQLSEVSSLSIGGDAAYRRLCPQSVSVMSFVEAETDDEQMRNTELALYTSYSRALTDRLSTTIGLRYGGVIGESGGLEPRVNLNYNIANGLSTNVSYTRQYQYVGQALVSGSAMPTNYFLLTSEETPAQLSNNFAWEVIYDNPSRTLQLSTMLYYRRLYNQYENSVQMTTLITEDIPFLERFECGDGRNYGIESMARFNFGAVTGWLSYTLSWALRSMDGIDNGATFYASNDRRHDLSLTASWKISDKWNTASTFVLASGQPFTQATGIYAMGGVAMVLYSDKNAGRMPMYHRMDLMVSREVNISWLRSSRLTMSIYNLYGRENGVFYHYRIRYGQNDTPESSDDTITITPFSTSLFTFLPSVGFTCNF